MRAKIVSLLAVFSAFGLILPLGAQTATTVTNPAGTPSTPPANVPLRSVVPTDAVQPASPMYEIAMKWNERGTNALTVPFKNDSDKPLTILGVQATRGIFVGDYPAALAPGKQDNISFVYNAADNTDGDLDAIRLLTSGGIKEILVRIAREPAVQFDTRELQWIVGGSPVTKTVTLTVAAGTLTPVRVKATGGNQAVLVAVNATTWQVNVTPGSMAKSGKFAVFVEFDKPLPGTAPVILGVIQPKE